MKDIYKNQSAPLKLKEHVLTERSKGALRQRVENYIRKHDSIKCPAFNNRPVFLDKWLDSNVIGRKNSQRQPVMRLQSFLAGAELIKRSHTADPWGSSKKSWSLKGLAPDGETVIVHIREDEIEKNRLLYWISSYHK